MGAIDHAETVVALKTFFADLESGMKVTVRVSDDITQYGTFESLMVTTGGKIWVKISVAGKGTAKVARYVFLLENVQGLEW